ncbi:HAMP domain-containing protein [Duganella sp. CY15W]|uniref:ATP-binding protein n=1 Tax=Duganella sp. CY15W TaxID=2692172 RepID=UPI0013697CA4|nr:ATP-binding protein [Duganella sp. CY15W]MYM28051.1 HAMP domain-containing protein [Duganella sp. CY15W]
MKLNAGISRQISMSMALVALGIILLVQISSYALYAWLLRYSPEFQSDPMDIWPTKEETIWLVVTTLLSLAIAVLAAGKLSRRILAPLNSVAESLRQVAQGNLAARATSDEHAMGETAQLVDDFNQMAARLQDMAQHRAFWNAAIAHELRTPVTILRGRLQGITEGVFAPEQSQFQSLLTQVEGLGRLIEDLRTVALAESGHLPLQRLSADLAEEVSSVVQLAEPLLQAAGFQLQLQLCREPVFCDPMRIRQALLALLENARKHATPGILRVSVSVADDVCRLCVEDQGPGIDAALARNVFDAFQRGDQSMRSETGGSGLGLAVVKAIALAHGGMAICRSSPLGGTAFELNWPST